MPSSMFLRNTLKRAAELNNAATLQIQQQDYVTAVSTLSSALVTMKDALRTDTTVASSTPSTDDEVDTMDVDRQTSSSSSSSTEASSSSSCLIQFLSSDHQQEQALSSYASSSSSPKCPREGTTECSSSSQSKQLLIAVDGDWYLYFDPVQIMSYEALVVSPVSIEILSYAIIYNLGLCHHLAALLLHSSHSTTTATASTRTLQLQRAVSFYTHAQRLMVGHSLSMDMIHTLVLTNNMGHAHHFLKNDSASKICFQRLLTAIMYLSSNESGPEGQKIRMENEPTLDCFLTNIMHLIMGSSSAAAAA